MDNNIINDDIIEKVVIKSVAIYKAMSVLSAPPFEDKFLNKQNICQQNENIQKQSLEKCLKETEPSKENEIIDTTNGIKKNLEKKSWKDITNPKERRKAYHKVYYEANKDKISKQNKAYRESNKDKMKDYQKDYNETNKDKIKDYHKVYSESNKDKIRLRKKAHYEINKDKIRVQKNNYYNNKRKTDIQFKLSRNLRSRLNSAVNGNYKSGSAIKDLGCTIEQLKQYLESKFQSGMTWDNWTLDGWHIDHIKPLASFDLTDRKQLLEACHYTNLQPLWAKDNLTKNDKII
jgi:hypothetical protein